MKSEQPAQRLGRLIKARRKALKLTQADVQAADGPSTATLRVIENGTHTDFRPSTSRPLEAVLGWAPGSVDNILAGGDPVTAEHRGQWAPENLTGAIAAAAHPYEMEIVLESGWSAATGLTDAILELAEPPEALRVAACKVVFDISGYLIVGILNSGHAPQLEKWLARIYREREGLYARLSAGRPDFAWKENFIAATGAMANGDDIEALRRELTRRVEAHPPSSWSSSLLAVVVSAIDLQFPDAGSQSGVGLSRARLRVVR